MLDPNPLIQGNGVRFLQENGIDVDFFDLALNRIIRESKLVRDAVVFEPGAKDGAVVPDISAPRLRAVFVPEKVENGRLIEAHREWVLEGDVAILGIPKESGQKGAHK